MSYLIRLWMATTVAATQNHPDPAHNRLNQNRRSFFSAGDSSEPRPMGNSDVDDRLGQADDSLRKVMYFNCWGQG
ncbi:hypothetical protein SESBI_46790 [Sesbania bispinosa]|nr:hypothetical protein SESBI_46790 [Sesbania bispinosa]